MKFSSALFDLIASMSKSEKRYFRLHVSLYAQDNPNYLRLFEAIAEQVKEGRYNELQIRKQFKGEKFAKQLHVAKNYLDQLICKSLAAYHTQNDAEARIYELLQTAVILHNKGLAKQALKKLAKAKKLATAYHKHLLLAKIHEKEEAIKTRVLDFDGAAEMIEEQTVALNNCSNILFNKQFGVKLYNYYLRTSSSRGASDVESFKSLIDFDALDMEENALNVRSKMYKYTARVLYENFLGNTDTQFEYQTRITNLFETHPQLIDEEPRQYLVALHNLAQIRFVRKEYTRVLILTERIRFVLEKFNVKRFPEVFIDSMQGAIEFDCWVNIKLCDPEAIRESLLLSEEFLKKYRSDLNSQTIMNIIYGGMIGWFYLDETKRALGWMNDLLSFKSEKVREDLIHVALVVNVAIHIDLGNYELVASLERSLIRNIKQQKSQNHFEGLFLSFIKKWMRADISKERRSAFRALAVQVREYEASEWEKNFLEYFDMTSWAEARSQMIPLLEQKKKNEPVL